MFLNYVLAIIFILFCSGCVNAKTQQNVNATELIESLLTNYDKRIRPNFEGQPVEVEVSMYVMTISEISDINMDYTIHVYFRQFWNDPRLSFHHSHIETLSLSHDFGKMIWIPDTFFVNDKESSLHSVTTKNEFVRVDRSGAVAKSVRLSLKISCPMNFRTYPMDRQVCDLDIESYGHNMKDLKYNWKKPGIEVNSNGISATLFNLVNLKEISESIHMTSGNYSRLKAQFEFVRTRGYYCKNIYIPCTMLVIIAWISFWVDHRASTVRLTLCSLALLLMVIGCQLLNIQLPKTPYTKAVDVFTGISLTFIFVALIECVYVLNKYKTNEKDNELQLKIDKIFVIGYPVAFAVFNIIYWAYYLSG